MSRIILPAAILTVLGILLIVRVCVSHRKHKRLWKTKLFTNNATLAIYLFFRILTLFTMLRALYLENFNNVLLCILTLLLLAMPSILERTLQIRIPTLMEGIILGFIFAAEILGEINHYYVDISGWDTMLHTINGFLCAAVGFSLINLLNRSERFSLSLSPLYLSIAAFCFSMTVGVLWEFFEFSMDYFMGFDMQKDFIITGFSSVTLDPAHSNTAVSVRDIVQTTIETADGQAIVLNGYLDIGIIDTMKDLFVNFVGAVIFSVIGYFYAKNHEKGKFAKQFIPQVQSKGDDRDGRHT